MTGLFLINSDILDALSINIVYTTAKILSLIINFYHIPIAS